MMRNYLNARFVVVMTQVLLMTAKGCTLSVAIVFAVLTRIAAHPRQ